MLYHLDAMGIQDFSQGAITKSLPKDYYTHICLSIHFCKAWRKERRKKKGGVNKKRRVNPLLPCFS